MNREVPYSENEKCDICNKGGAFDFMGDLICADCLKDIPTDDEGYFIEEAEND